LVADLIVMNRKLVTGGLLTVALLTATGLAFAAAGASVQVSLGSSATTIAANELMTYTAKFSCASSVADCTSGSLSIDIPTPLQLVGAPPSGGFIASSSTSGNTVLFTLVDPLTAGSSGSVDITVKAPSCKQAGQPAPGPLTATAKISAVGTAENATASPVTIAPFPDCVASTYARPFSKWGSDAAVGGLNYWSIYAPSQTVAYSIEDVLPAGLVVHNLGADSGLAVLVDCGAGYIPVNEDLLWATPQPAGCALPGQEVSQYRYQNLAKIRIDVSANTSGSLWLRTFTDSPLTAGTSVKNCATQLAPAVGTSCSTVNVFAPAALPDTQSFVIGAPNLPLGPPPDWLNPGPVSDSGATKLGRRDLAYSIRVVNNEQAGGDLVDPVITQLLDANLEYTFGAGGNWWTSYAAISVEGGAPAAFDPAQQPGCKVPLFEVIPNAVGARTLLRWTFKGCSLHGGWSGVSAVGVYVSARMRAAVIPGMTVTSDSASSPVDVAAGATAVNTVWCNDDLIDTADLDGDSLKTDRLCNGNAASWTMPQGAEALSAEAWVKGASDPVATRYPATATTDLSGTTTYEFSLSNSGSSPLSRLDLVDILPSVGDVTAAAPGEPRLSEWDMELVGVDKVEREDAFGALTTVPAGQFTVGLSTSRNPCRWDSSAGDQVRASGGVFAPVGAVTGPAGCVPDTWSAVTATPALSFALVYQPTAALAPGESLRITMRARLNGGPPPPSATPRESWNSVAYTATLLGMNGPFTLLTGEPLKVGVRYIDPAATAGIGGVVWKDFNANGLRDDGDASSLENIAVSVYDSAGVIVTTVQTDADGVYQLAGLTPNATYRIEVSLEPGDYTLDGYFVSPANVGADPLLNSHAVQTATKAVILGQTGAAGTVDMKHNFGVAKNNPPT
jgi:SdrD B-like domain